MFERQYMEAAETNDWEMELAQKEMELQKKQNELRAKQMKLENWEKDFQHRQSIVTSNGIVIKKIFNA